MQALYPCTQDSHKNNATIEHVLLENSTLSLINSENGFYWKSEVSNTVDVIVVLDGGVGLVIDEHCFIIDQQAVFVKNSHENLCVHCLSTGRILRLSVPEAVFRCYLLDYFGIMPVKAIVFDNVVKCDSEAFSLSFQSLVTLDISVKEFSALVSRDLLFGLLEKQVVLAIMNVLNWSYLADIRGVVADLKPRYVKRAIDYLIVNEKQKISVHDLVVASGTGLRTLQNGFLKSYGITPMCYVRRYKLKRIREYFLANKGRDVVIGDVAAQWGLMHPSNFAKNYYEFFGEYPSETLGCQRYSALGAKKLYLSAIPAIHR